MSLYVDIRKKLSGFSLDASFEVGKTHVGLLGASGSGKSMTLRCIAGVETPDCGKIILNGHTLYDSEKGINLPSRKRKVGLLFQNYALFPNMTIEKNIRFGLGNMKAEMQTQKIMEMIRMMKLEGLENRYPSQLSGGQQQRVALARALAIEPEALLLDEPFSALDEHLRQNMIKQMLEMLSNYEGVTIFVTHNLEEAYRLCEELVILSSGRLEIKGKKEEIFMNPSTIEAARITGCKNISAAKQLSDNEIEALDWGIKLKADLENKNDLSYVGIRAHYIDIAKDDDNENVFKCFKSFISETPFRVTVYLSIGKEPENSEHYHIQWEVSKERWNEIKDKEQPWNIKLSAEKLLLMSD